MVPRRFASQATSAGVPTTLHEVSLHRLHNQQLSHHAFRRPEQVVEWMLAVQGQEYDPGKWAIGLRTPRSDAKDIERCVQQAKILRTWPMRGTIHFLAAKDARWMLDLLAPRVIQKFATYYRRERLDTATFVKSRKIIVDNLVGGKRLDRPTLYGLLEKGGVRTKKIRGLFILGRLAMEGLICFGPKSGNQPTFALLEEWAPAAGPKEQEESLRELGRRYFTSHGPATIHDLAFWAGLKISDAKRAAELAADDLVPTHVGATDYWMSKDVADVSRGESGTYLLPTYDEFLIGYRDRRAALEPGAPIPKSLFTATIVSDGRVVGFWRRTTKKGTVDISTQLFKPNRLLGKDIEDAAARFGDFFGLHAQVS